MFNNSILQKAGNSGPDIQNLPDASSIANIDRVVLVQGGVAKDISADTFRAFVLSGVSNFDPSNLPDMSAIGVSDRFIIVQNGIAKDYDFSAIKNAILSGQINFDPANILDASGISAGDRFVIVQNGVAHDYDYASLKGAILAGQINFDPLNLPDVSSIADADRFVIIQGGVAKDFDYASLKAAVLAGRISFDPASVSATDTAVDADELAIKKNGETVFKRVPISALPRARDSFTVAVPGDYATIAAALAYIDTQTLKIGATAKVAVSGVITENLSLTDKRYDKVSIEGPALVSEAVSAVAVAAKVGSYYPVTITLPAGSTIITNLLALSAANRFIMLRSASRPGTYGDTLFSGFWFVSSIDSINNKITLQISVRGSNGNVTTSNGPFTATLFGALWVPAASGTFTALILTRSALKVSNVGMTSLRGYQTTGVIAGLQDAINLFASTLIIGGGLEDAICSLAINGAVRGIYGFSSEILGGSWGVSDCSTSGTLVYGTKILTGPIISTGHDAASVGGFSLWQGSTCRVSMSSTAPASHFSGSTGFGITLSDEAAFSTNCMQANYNTASANGVYAQYNSRATISGSSTVGSLLPAANTSGNTGCMITKY